MTALRHALVLGVAAWLAACTDPGCIRNSECGAGYVCLQQVCVVDRDGGQRDLEDAGRE